MLARTRVNAFDQLGGSFYGSLGERCCGVEGSRDRDRMIGCPWGCEGEESVRKGWVEDITSLNIPKEVSGLELRERSGLNCGVLSHQCTSGETERRRGPNTEPGKEPEKAMGGKMESERYGRKPGTRLLKASLHVQGIR